MYSLMMTANGHIDPRSSMAPPIIMRTAATPMPTPKSSLGPESIVGEELMYREGVPGEAGLGFSDAGIGHMESRRGSSTSMDPLAYDQRSLVSCIKQHITDNGLLGHHQSIHKFTKSIVSSINIDPNNCNSVGHRELFHSLGPQIEARKS